MNNLDDLFKNKLEQNGLEFQEEYWNEMEGIIDLENKKKRRFILFFSGLFVILIGSIMGLLFSGNYKNEKLAGLSSTPTARVETNASNTHNSDNKAILEEKIAQVENKKPNNLESNTQITKPSKRKSISKNQEKALSTNLPQVVSNNSNSANSQPSNKLRENPVNINTLNYGIETDDKDHLVFADFMRFNTSKIELEQVLPHTCKNCAHGLKSDSVKPKAKVNWVYQIGLEALYNLNSRTGINSSFENSKNNFGYLTTFSAHKRHWGFKTGLEYYKYQEQNNYKNTTKSYTYDTSYSLINAFYSFTPKGTRIALLCRHIDTTRSEKEVLIGRGFWQIQTLQIPILLNYQTIIKQLSLQCFMGLNAGFIVQRSGNINIEKQGLYQSSQIKDQAMRHLLWQSQAGFALLYPIYKNFQLQASYRYYQSYKSLFKDRNSHLMRQSIGLGIQYQID